MPANGGTLIPLRVPVGEEQRELEGVRQRDELELGRSRQRLGDVAAVEGTAEAGVNARPNNQPAPYLEPRVPSNVPGTPSS